MKTVTDNFQELADEITELLQTLLLRYSSLYQWNKDDPSSGVVFISVQGDYGYRELSKEGRQIQSKLLEEYRRFNSMLKTLLREQPEDVLRKFEEATSLVFQTIEQQHTWCKTPQEAFSQADEALKSQIALLKNLYDPTNGDVYYVPDTNALLYNPTLENWRFDGVMVFTLVLTPTILSELDEQKINHRNEVVRDKAEALIRQVKEYRRRGKLYEGVVLVRDKSYILSIAIEPNLEHSLPWLDSSNNDDRFLASVIEVMRFRPRSVVVAVSRDVNFQNKADFARVPVVEPPDK